LIDAHLRPQGQNALVRLSNYFASAASASDAVQRFSRYDVEGAGFITPKDFVKYVTSLPLPVPVAMEEAVLLVQDLDTLRDGRVFWKTLGKAIELASARQVALASMDDGEDGEAMRPKDIALDKAHWRDPNREQKHWSLSDISKNAVAFRFASLKALQAPLEDIDRAFLSQFISMMRRDGIKVVKHGRHNTNKRTIRLNNKATHITWNSPRAQVQKNMRPAVIALLDVVEVTRGAFPGSVAMPMGKVKRCVSVLTPVRMLLMEAEFEEDADLLFAGLAILSLGKASKKMQDQRKKLKDKKIEAELSKKFSPNTNHSTVASQGHALLRSPSGNGSPMGSPSGLEGATGLEGKLARVEMENI